MKLPVTRAVFAKAAATGGLAIAACAACCAPLIVPLVAPWAVALFAGTGAGLALVGQTGLALAIVTGAGAFIWWRRVQRAKAEQVASEKSCGCAPGAGCNAGDACELPAAKT